MVNEMAGYKWQYSNACCLVLVASNVGGPFVV
jgi:hypothetical protein